MKYIKLFEAIESEKITKTLGFLSKPSAKAFLEQLSKICSRIDFPLSKLDDSYFEYLPYRAALKRTIATGDDPCDYESPWIKGEFCKKGKVKRTWGNQIRSVECPNCQGTGVKPKTSELKLIKFWFSKDGGLVGTTAVDGVVRKPVVTPKGYSKDINDYELVSNRLVGIRTIQNFENGTPILIKIGSQEVVAHTYNRWGSVYAIQDFYAGSTPGGTEWQKFGTKALNVSYARYEIKKLKPKEMEGNAKTDPFFYNTGFYLPRYGEPVINQKESVEALIKNADFAIVFDYKRLKDSGYKSSSDIKSEREERKEGSRLTMTDDDIRKANISRYLQKLSQKSDIIDDIKNVKSLTNRVLGGRYSLFIIYYRSRFNTNFSKIIEKYYEILHYQKRGNEDNKNYCIETLNSNVRSLFEQTSGDVKRIGDNLKQLKIDIEVSDLDERYKKILKGLEELSQIIFDKLMSSPFDSIDDLEVLKGKISGIRELLFSSQYGLNNLEYFIDQLASGSNSERLMGRLSEWRIRENVDKILEGIESLKRIIPRF